MINDLTRETTAVGTPGTQVAKSSRRHVRIEVDKKDRPRLWKLIAENEWSGEYVGKNVFVFTDEQLTEVQRAEIPFRELS